jgi:hypothetical protein
MAGDKQPKKNQEYYDKIAKSSARAAANDAKREQALQRQNKALAQQESLQSSISVLQAAAQTSSETILENSNKDFQRQTKINAILAEKASNSTTTLNNQAKLAVLSNSILQKAKTALDIDNSKLSNIESIATNKGKMSVMADGELQKSNQLVAADNARVSVAEGFNSNKEALVLIYDDELQKSKLLLTVDNARVASVEATSDALKRIALTKNKSYQLDLQASAIADQRASIEEDIAKFVRDQAVEREKELDPSHKLLEQMQKRKDRQKEITKDFDEYKEKFEDFIDIIQDPSVATGLFIVEMGRQASKFADTMATAGDSMKMSRTQTASMAGEMAGANILGAAFGVSAKQNADSMAGLAEGMGDLNDISASAIVQVSNIARQTGLSEVSAGKLVGHMKLVEGSSVESSKETLKVVSNLARGAGLPIGKVMEDVADNMELTSKFGNISVKELGAMAVQAGKLGTSLSQMSALGDKLMDIDTARASAMELSVLLGRQVNVDKAQQLMYEGKIDESYSEMLKQVGGLEAFGKMDYFQKKATAELMNTTTADLEKQLNKAAGLTESGEKQAGWAATAMETTARMGGYLKENATTIAATTNLLGSGVKALGGFAPALKGMGGKVVDKLKGSKLGGALGHGKDKAGDMADMGKKQMKSSDKLGAGGKKGGIKKKMQDLAAGLRSMGKGTFKGILALALAGPALLMALPSIPFLLFMGMVPLAMLATNFKFLASGLKSLGKGFSSILKGLLVLGLLGVAMIPAAFAFSLLEGVNPLSIIAFSGSLIILGLAAAGMGFLIGPILMGSIALLALGLAIIPAAMAMKQLGGVDPAAIIGFALGLALMGAAVAGMGLMLPFILLGTLSAHALGFAITPAVEALSGLEGIDGNAIIQFGVGLGLIAASVAGMGLMLPFILLGAVSAQALGLAINPAVEALSGLTGVDPAAIIPFSIGLGLIGAAVAGMGLMLPFILLGAMSAQALGMAIAPAAEALGGLTGIDPAAIIPFSIGLGLIAAAVAGMGMMFGAILMGTLGLAAISAVLPQYAQSLGLIPEGLDVLGFATGTAALGLAGIVLIPGALGFTLMAGALTLFAASLLLLVPLMPVLDKLGSLGLFGMEGGGGESKTSEGDTKDKGNEEIINKLDELISVIRAGGKVVMDGKEVGKVIQLASGPIGG